MMYKFIAYNIYYTSYISRQVMQQQQSQVVFQGATCQEARHGVSGWHTRGRSIKEEGTTQEDRGHSYSQEGQAEAVPGAYL